MATLLEQRAAKIKQAQDIINGVKAAERDLTKDETEQLDGIKSELQNIDGKIEQHEKSTSVMDEFTKAFQENGQKAGPVSEAKSLGDHFVKHLEKSGRSLLEAGHVEAPEFKSDSDPNLIGRGGVPSDAGWGPLITDIDTDPVRPIRRELTIADLLDSGPVSGNSISYPVYPALEGKPEFIGEAEKKPGIKIGKPTWQTDALGEIAGHFTISDDMAEDAPFVVSEINSEGLFALALAEEHDLLFGDGSGKRLTGILERKGVQTLTAKSKDDNLEALYRAITKARTGSGRPADGIVVNPIDYERIRLSRDGNGQYYAGGPFAGQYGQGGLMDEPAIWAKRTVVTEAVPEGTAVVGAWSSGKVFRKGGVRVESTNSHSDDFTHDRITIRLRSRLGLQVKRPAGFVKVTLK